MNILAVIFQKRCNETTKVNQKSLDRFDFQVSAAVGVSSPIDRIAYHLTELTNSENLAEILRFRLVINPVAPKNHNRRIGINSERPSFHSDCCMIILKMSSIQSHWHPTNCHPNHVHDSCRNQCECLVRRHDSPYIAFEHMEHRVRYGERIPRSLLCRR